MNGPPRTRPTSTAAPPAIILTGLVMLAWSWKTWCDPLIDFGTELYVPWQMTAGKVLYRDLHYFNGPFTQYLNSSLFLLLGVSIRTLVIGNLAVLIGLMIVLYRLIFRAFGAFSACACGLTFMLLFGFGQGVSTGNYNWVTPYRNDLTHGLAMGVLAIALLDRYARSRDKSIDVTRSSGPCPRRSDGKNRALPGSENLTHGPEDRVTTGIRSDSTILVAAGLVTGLVFLTRSEPFLSTAAAVGAMSLARWWLHRTPIRTVMIESAIFIAAMLAMPLIALALLSLKMPVSVAAIGVLGSWPWVFDGRVTALPFYQNIAGTDDIAGNLSTILLWSIGYAGIAGGAIGLSFRVKSKRISASVLVFFLCALAMFIASRVFVIDWNSIIRPLPVCLAAMLIFAVIPIFRRSGDERASLRLGLIIFAIALVMRIALNVHVYHYGFALAMPGVLLLVGVLGDDLPGWIRSRGGNGNVFRAVAAVCWATAVFVTLYVDQLAFLSKRNTIGTGGDEFLTGAVGAEVKHIVELIDKTTPPDSTLMVLPQGLMVNYLTRRVHPIASLNFMPPEVLAEGEDAILAMLRAHPPDEIVVNRSVIEGGEFTLEHRYSYGSKTLDWVLKNYVQADVQASGPIYRFVVMVRRKR